MNHWLNKRIQKTLSTEMIGYNGGPAHRFSKHGVSVTCSYKRLLESSLYMVGLQAIFELNSKLDFDKKLTKIEMHKIWQSLAPWIELRQKRLKELNMT